MDFKHEYQNEMHQLSPTEEQLERIKKEVARRIAESEPEPKKKPPYLKIAAFSGASVCAAAVLMFVFIGATSGVKGLLPGTTAADKMNNTAAGGSSDKYVDQSLTIGDGTYGCTTASSGSSHSIITGGGYDFEGYGTPGSSLSPDSGGDRLDSINHGSTEAADSMVPSLIFSEDKSQCVVISNGVERLYKDNSTEKEETAGNSVAFGETVVPNEALLSVRSNLDVELLVWFGEDNMAVFTENGKLYKLYTLI